MRVLVPRTSENAGRSSKFVQSITVSISLSDNCAGRNHWLDTRRSQSSSLPALEEIKQEGTMSFGPVGSGILDVASAFLC